MSNSLIDSVDADSLDDVLNFEVLRFCPDAIGNKLVMIILQRSQNLLKIKSLYNYEKHH